MEARRWRRSLARRTKAKKSSKVKVKGRRSCKKALRGLEGKPYCESSGTNKALIDLPKLDISVMDKECVLLLVTDTDDTLLWAPVLAWYPEEQLVGVVTNRLLPQGFVPMASCSGLLCGIYGGDVLDDWVPDWPRLRVAVCNPRTGLQLELPVVSIIYRGKNTPDSAHTYGHIKLEMSGNQDRFSIHVLCTQAEDLYAVYTWHSSSQVWVSSTSNGRMTGNLAGELIFRGSNLQAYDIHSETWTAMPIPGAKAWNDFPLPQGFEGYTYQRVDPFRYGRKVMVVGQCRNKSPGAIVLLELEEEEGGRQWKPVVWANSDRFIDYSTPFLPPVYAVDWPLQCGDLVVMRAGTCSMLDRPIVLHLKHHNWLKLPSSVSRLNLQAVGIYNP